MGEIDRQRDFEDPPERVWILPPRVVVGVFLVVWLVLMAGGPLLDILAALLAAGILVASALVGGLVLVHLFTRRP